MLAPESDMAFSPQRRVLLLSALAAPFATVSMLSHAEAAELTLSEARDQLVQLETSSGGRLGLFAYDTVFGTRVQYRDEERFPVCSTFKIVVVGAILKRSEMDPELLQRRIRYEQDDVRAAGYAPITQKHVQDGMTIAELCAAALQYSDNAAANLLMKELDGPDTVTGFARSTGDESFRLDRWEPQLNTALPGDERDTSTPQAMAFTLQRLTLGEALAEPQRGQMRGWMLGNTTGAQRIRAGVPRGWLVADKTGTGDYGTTNDVALLLPPGGPAFVIAIYFTQTDPHAKPREDVLAAATRIAIQALM
jgi:beta-lactamase class A